VGNIRDEVSMVVSVSNESAEHPQVRNQIRVSAQVAKSAPRNISWVFVDSSDMLGKRRLEKDMIHVRHHDDEQGGGKWKCNHYHIADSSGMS
jgi:hypothetical protein